MLDNKQLVVRRKVTQEEFDRAAELHRSWLRCRAGTRMDFCYADLQGIDMSRAYIPVLFSVEQI